MRLRIHPAVVLGAAVLGSALWLWGRASTQMSRDLGAFMRLQVQNSHFSGTVLVAREGRVLFARGYGMADLGRGIVNGVDTKYPIASLSKQFTALLVMQLQRQGKLAVSDRICRHLAPCPDAWSSILISQLLSHTSGIPNFTDDPSFMAARGGAKSRAEILATFSGRPLEFPPGAQYRYSNSNYYVLAILVEKASGMSFEAALRRNVLEPLHMNESGLESGASPIAHQARGYRRSADGSPAEAQIMDPSWSLGGGDMYSTVQDLKKWDEALYGEQLLPRAALQTMWTPVKEGYGFGWEIPPVSRATLNRRLLSHSGHTDGFVSCMSRFPDQRALVVVLSNFEMVKHACNVAGGLAAIAFGEADMMRPDPVEVQLDPRLAARYVGKYRVSSDTDVIVTLEAGHLFATIGQIPKAELFASSEREFFFKVFDTELEFKLGADGSVTGFIAHIPLRADVAAVRVP